MSGPSTGSASAATAAPSCWVALRAGLAVSVGLLLGLFSAASVGLGHAYLASVFVTGDLVTKSAAPSSSWAIMIAVTAAAVGLLTIPTAWAPRVDPVALVGAAWLLGWTAAFAWVHSAAEFTGSQPPCVYASCWPRYWQELAAAAPLVATTLVMVGLAMASRHLPRLVRAAVPALTFVVLSLVQVAIWDSTVIPVLHGPPPF